MLLAKTSEVIEKEKQIEQLLHSHQQQQRNQYKLHRQYIQSIVDKSKQADERVVNAKDMARVAEKKQERRLNWQGKQKRMSNYYLLKQRRRLKRQ